MKITNLIKLLERTTPEETKAQAEILANIHITAEKIKRKFHGVEVGEHLNEQLNKQTLKNKNDE